MEVRIVGREWKVWCVACRAHVPVRPGRGERAA